MRTHAVRIWMGSLLIAAVLSTSSFVAPAGAATIGVTVAGGHGAGRAADQLSFPTGAAVDADGNLYIADENNLRVQRWAPGAASGVTVVESSEGGLALDGAGNLYITDFADRVLRWAPGATSGVVVAGGNGQGSAANQLYIPYRVTVDEEGNVYVADAANSRVQRWAPGATEGVTVAGGNGVGSAADQLSYPEGVAVDGVGNVYVADAYNSRVQRWAAGATAGVTVAGGNGAGAGANQLSRASVVALDDQGNVYVADPDNHRVQQWAPGATAGITVAGGNGAGPAAQQLDYPQGMAVDASGNVYVADSNNNRVQLWPSRGPAVVPGSSSAPEGVAGTTVVSVPVTLSVPSTLPVTVAWNTLVAPGAPAGQADPGVDYSPASGSVVFAPGEVSKTVPVSVHGDTLVEPHEYIVVSFHSPTGASMGGFWGLGFVSIVADDVIVRPGVTSVVEGGSGAVTVDVPVALTEPASGTVTVEWETLLAPGSIHDQADPSTDYDPASGTVTFGPGETTATASIRVIGDTLVEPDELILVRFHDPTGAAIGNDLGLGGIIVIDDD